MCAVDVPFIHLSKDPPVLTKYAYFGGTYVDKIHLTAHKISVSTAHKMCVCAVDTPLIHLSNVTHPFCKCLFDTHFESVFDISILYMCISYT